MLVNFCYLYSALIIHCTCLGFGVLFKTVCTCFCLNDNLKLPDLAPGVDATLDNIVSGASPADWMAQLPENRAATWDSCVVFERWGDVCRCWF